VLRVIALVVLVLVVVGVAVDRTITDGVERLIDHAHRIRDGDYRSRSTLKRGDEIGELGRAFDEMADRLETSRASLEAAYDELADLNAELQDRVDARTRDLEQAQERLISAAQSEVIAEVGAGLAHELNNPLAVILGQVELARARGRADEAALKRVETAARRCRDVVASIQSLVSGGVEASSAPVVDLVQTAREAITAVQVDGERRRVRLEDGLGDATLTVRGDAAVLARGLTTFLRLLAAVVGEGAHIRLDADGASILVRSSRPVRTGRGRDDWRAAAVRLWGARRLLELAGARLVPEDEAGSRWRLSAAGDAA